jgi:hypothetical protein
LFRGRFRGRRHGIGTRANTTLQGGPLPPGNRWRSNARTSLTKETTTAASAATSTFSLLLSFLRLICSGRLPCAGATNKSLRPSQYADEEGGGDWGLCLKRRTTRLSLLLHPASVVEIESFLRSLRLHHHFFSLSFHYSCFFFVCFFFISFNR